MLKKILERLQKFDEKHCKLSKIVACTLVFLAVQGAKLIFIASYREAIIQAVGL